jgi:drug/metabolite transporter (DMT)-like permease
VFKSYRHLEISKVDPLRNLSPIFLAVFAFFILGEKISVINFIGILIIIVGAYIIQVDHTWMHVIKNLKVFKNKHIDKMIIAMILVSFVAIIDKVLIVEVGLITIMFFTFWMMFINLFLMFNVRYNGWHGIITSIRQNSFWMIVISVFSLISLAFFYNAIALPGVFVSLVIPIKRLSTLFSTIIGGEIFHDHGLKIRIIGCIITLIGIAFIVW